jgi:ribose transport system ATP-binding protein
MENYSLTMRGIVKWFPGVVALDGVDFDLRPNEVHALLGINGAGKSTLIKILSGSYRKDAGAITINGKPIEINNPNDARAHGIATVYQDPQMIPSFTGYENIFLGSETGTRSVFSRINRREMHRRALQLLQRYPFDVDVTRRVNELETVQKEIIAVLRALAVENTSILVLDEPTSILTGREIDILFNQIAILKRAGVSIIYITHRLEEVFQVADRFTVLRDGKAVGTYEVGKAVDTGEIAELMLGEKLSQVYPEKSYTPGEVVLSVDGLTLDEKFTDISFDVRRGEILGIFGLVGSGFDELCKTIFGIGRASSGRILLNGREIAPRSPSHAIKQGIFLIPGDRRTEGQILDESVAFNTTLANLKQISGLLGLIKWWREQRDVRRIINMLSIKTPDLRQEVSLLSGGNQQKIVIGKGLYSDSQVYIFEEPTVGVDVGAKAGIYHQIREVSHGKGVVVMSSDVEEVYGICDRAIVLHEGRIVLDKPVNETKLDELLVYGLTGGSDGNGRA